MVNYCVCGGCTNSSLSGHRVHRFPKEKWTVSSRGFFSGRCRYLEIRAADFFGPICVAEFLSYLFFLIRSKSSNKK